MDEWPPADADALLGKWRDLGQPELQLSPGITIHNLERWFYPQVPHEPPYREVQRVREQLGHIEAPTQAVIESNWVIRGVEGTGEIA